MNRNELIDLKSKKRKYISAKGHGNPTFNKEVEEFDLMLVENSIEPLIL